MRHTVLSLAQQYSELLNFGAGNPDPRARRLLTHTKSKAEARKHESQRE